MSPSQQSQQLFLQPLYHLLEGSPKSNSNNPDHVNNDVSISTTTSSNLYNLVKLLPSLLCLQPTILWYYLPQHLPPWCTLLPSLGAGCILRM